MKKSSFLLALCFSAGALCAQVQRKTAKRTAPDSTMTARQGKKDVRKKMRELNLSKDQKGKLKEVRQQNKAAKDAVENDASLNDQQKQDKLKGLKKAHAGEMKNILTDDQKAKLKAMRKNKKEEDQ